MNLELVGWLHLQKSNPKNRHRFSEALNKALSQKKISKYGLAKQMQCRREQVSRWVSAESLPEPETQIKLSELLNFNLKEIYEDSIRG